LRLRGKDGNPFINHWKKGKLSDVSKVGDAEMEMQDSDIQTRPISFLWK